MQAIRGGLFPGQTMIDDPVNLMGIPFRNRIGLAPGFDKDGEAIDQWERLGFGFVEVGTVTRQAQPGNPAPRMFRIPEHQALINRMGFNNKGADEMARNLEEKRASIPVGVNIGKSKVTPLEDAVADYAYSFTLLAPLCDYVAVNVSSPNTPGLRKLQDAEHLRKILDRLRLTDDEKPLVLKIAPDLTMEQLEEIAALAEEFKLEGIAATNTTIERPEGTDIGEDGGLSGAPLTQRATAMMRDLRQMLPKTVLFGVGGVMTAEDAVQRANAGADLVQGYTGFIYGGPGWPATLAEALADHQASTWQPS